MDRTESKITDAKKIYFAQGIAVIDSGCKIDKATKIWQFSHLISASKNGEQYSYLIKRGVRKNSKKLFTIG